MRRCVRSRDLVNEEAVTHLGLSRQKQTNKQTEANTNIHLRCNYVKAILTSSKLNWRSVAVEDTARDYQNL